MRSSRIEEFAFANSLIRDSPNLAFARLDSCDWAIRNQRIFDSRWFLGAPKEINSLSALPPSLSVSAPMLSLNRDWRLYRVAVVCCVCCCGTHRCITSCCIDSCFLWKGNRAALESVESHSSIPRIPLPRETETQIKMKQEIMQWEWISIHQILNGLAYATCCAQEW